MTGLNLSIRVYLAAQMTELSSAVQQAFISARFHGGVSIFKTKNIKPKIKP
jgi:hypothetical protein